MDQKKVRKPRLTGVTRSSLGSRLRAFRVVNNLLQADLGKELGLSGRVISDIERGIRDLTKKEQEAFEKKYKVKLNEIELLEGASHAPEPQLFTQLEFFQIQQEFLYEHRFPERDLWFAYDLWFFNPQSLPMLESGEVKATWTENLRAGATYNTVWFFDFTTTWDLQHFLENSKNVLKDLEHGAAGHRKSQTGKIHIYPIQIGFALTNDDNPVATDYRQLFDEWRAKSSLNDCLQLHPILSLNTHSKKQEILDLILDFSLRAACVVGYNPRKPLQDPPAVVLALRNVGVFGQSAPGWGYCILGYQETMKRFLLLARTIEESFREVEKVNG